MLINRLVLQLNAYYEPIRIIKVRKALKMITKGVAVVVLPTQRELYPGVFMPSVIKLVQPKYIPIRTRILSRRNVYSRDGYRCMYCGRSQEYLLKMNMGGLELDHIIPRTQGGRNTWENLVAACRRCNGRKGGRTPEEAGMQLIHRPLPPNIHTPRFILKQLGSEVNEWEPYLFVKSDGDKRFMHIGS